MQGRHGVGTQALALVRNTPACAGKTAGYAKNKYDVKETPLRAQGRLFGLQTLHTIIRNTPACAGKTDTINGTLANSEKHPCVRREDPRMGGEVSASLETPLRAQGRHFVVSYWNMQRRNTPACAGKTRLTPLHFSWGQKHPCVRREDTISVLSPPTS